jgi:hypothetical protein
MAFDVEGNLYVTLPGVPTDGRLVAVNQIIKVDRKGTGACSSTTRLGISEAGPPSRGARPAGMPETDDQIIRAPPASG